MESINFIIRNILSPALGIIGAFLLVTGGFKTLMSLRERNNSGEYNAGVAQLILGLAFLSFTIFIMPTLQSAVNSMSSGGSALSGDSVSIVEEFKKGTPSNWKTDETYADSSGAYQSALKKAGNVYAQCVGFVFKAIFSGANIMTGSNEGAVMSVAQNYINNTLVQNGIKILTPVGGAIALMFFIFSLVQLGQEERLTLEIFVKHFAKFFVSLVLILNSYNIYKAFFDFGKEITDYLVGSTGGRLTVSDSDITAISEFMQYSLFTKDKAGLGPDDSLNIWEGIGTFASTLPIGLLLLIVSAALLGIMYFIAFSRILELGARGVFLPVALGLIADDGWRGAGGRYIKKLLAIASQIAVLVVISVAAANIISKVATSILMGQEILGSLVAFLGVGFAVVSVMFKSIGLVNDVFGA